MGFFDDVGHFFTGSEGTAADTSPALSFKQAILSNKELIAGAVIGHGLAAGLFPLSTEAGHYANLATGSLVLISGAAIGGMHVYQRVPRGGNKGIFDRGFGMVENLFGSAEMMLNVVPYLMIGGVVVLLGAGFFFVEQGGATELVKKAPPFIPI